MCCPALLRACGNHSGEAEHDSGIGLKPFGFIPEPVFIFIPESCSRSSRNTVRNHPGIAFTLPRIPHLGLHDTATGTISLLDKTESNILWSDEAGDRHLFFNIAHRGGERQVAQRLVEKLKKAMGY